MNNPYFTTVPEAIERGRRDLITIPGRFVMAGALAWGFIFFKSIWLPALHGDGFSNFRQTALLGIGISLVSVAAALLWRGLHSADWKIWALENVQDAHRLYQLAEAKGMIWARKSWLNFLEFRTHEQQERLAELEMRLDKPRQMEVATPSGMLETRVFRYSFKKFLLQIGVLALFFGGFTAAGFGGGGFFPFGFFFLIVVVVQLVRWLPRLRLPEAIRLDADGITLRKRPTVAWADVADIFLEHRQQGKSSTRFLVVKTKEETPKPVEIDTADLDADDVEIEAAAHEFWASWRARK